MRFFVLLCFIANSCTISVTMPRRSLEKSIYAATESGKNLSWLVSWNRLSTVEIKCLTIQCVPINYRIPLFVRAGNLPEHKRREIEEENRIRNKSFAILNKETTTTTAIIAKCGRRNDDDENEGERANRKTDDSGPLMYCTRHIQVTLHI